MKCIVTIDCPDIDYVPCCKSELSDLLYGMDDGQVDGTVTIEKVE